VAVAADEHVKILAISCDTAFHTLATMEMAMGGTKLAARAVDRALARDHPYFVCGFQS
jgi:hypothetical protein